MFKLTSATLILFWAAPVPPAAPVCVLPPLAAASLRVEYNATEGTAALVLEAESDEAVRRVRLIAPGGSSLLDLSRPPGQGLSISGLSIETDDSQLGSLFEAYPEGTYEVRALAVGGGRILGSATLSHELPQPPVIGFPGAGTVGVPTSGLLLVWTGSPAADGYEVALEQGENDGLRIRLPPGSTSFLVPDGFLAPSTPTQVEIAAISGNGNRTSTVVEFTTD